jgi:hypothetical protein
VGQVGVDLKKNVWNIDFTIKDHTLQLKKKIERAELQDIDDRIAKIPTYEETKKF